MTTNHLETWLTEAETAARLGISERTLRRKTAAGNGPEKRERQRPGLRPEPVYNPDDVARLAEPRPTVFSSSSALAPRPAVNPPAVAALDQLAALLHNGFLPRRKPAARWLTLEEASATSGLSRTLLRRLVVSGRLPSIRDRSIKILQADLDSLDNVEELTALSVTRKIGGAHA